MLFCYFIISTICKFENSLCVIRLVKIKEQYIYCGSVTYGYWKILNRNDNLIQILGDCTEYKLVEIIRDISVFFHISDIVYFSLFPFKPMAALPFWWCCHWYFKFTIIAG